MLGFFQISSIPASNNSSILGFIWSDGFTRSGSRGSNPCDKGHHSLIRPYYHKILESFTIFIFFMFHLKLDQPNKVGCRNQNPQLVVYFASNSPAPMVQPHHSTAALCRAPISGLTAACGCCWRASRARHPLCRERQPFHGYNYGITTVRTSISWDITPINL